MAEGSSLGDIAGSSGVFEDLLRGTSQSGDPNLSGGANIDIGRLSSDVNALRELGAGGLGASDAVKSIIDRFNTFNTGGGFASDPEVSLATESNLKQQSNVLKSIQGQAALLGPGATSALGRTQGQALTDFGVARSNIPTDIRDKFFKQFTPLLQAALGTEAGAKQATIGAEQSVQGFDLGITNQALQNALQFGPIEEGRFGQQKELSNIAAQAQIDAANAANSGAKESSTAGAVGQIGGSLIMAAALSDCRAKENIEIIDGEKALAITEKINGYGWQWKDGRDFDMGVIAQEVYAVFPEAVVTDHPDGLWRVKYTALVGIFAAANKELQKQLNALKEEKENGF